ncbi:MAG: cysteine synthase family protein [Chloroflexota bacterium]|nr:MAG: cysteine synthase family protein [Chloroflexota bacterium]
MTGLRDSVLGTVGNTPLVAIDRLRSPGAARVAVKLEAFSPGGSVKDRAALRIIEDAERSGALRPGMAVVELTSGNMGIGLAVACAIKGYRMIAVMSDGNSVERRQILAAHGAEVDLVPQVDGARPGQVSAEDLAAVEDRTRSLALKLGAYRPDQFNNVSAVRAHEEGTGPEIWRQTNGAMTHFVASVGTGGTFVGVARALKRIDRWISCVAAEPASAPALAGGPIRSTSHRIQGTGYAEIPPFWDATLCDGFLTTTDDEAIATARVLATREGILGGFSTGANVAAALRLAAGLPAEALVVTIAPDTGLKYLSTELFVDR